MKELWIWSHVKRQLEVFWVVGRRCCSTQPARSGLSNAELWNRHVKGVSKAALLKFPDDGITVDTPIEFEEYDNVEFALVDLESDDEE